MDERTAQEYVAAHLEQTRRECAASRQEAEARVRPLFHAADEVIRWHREQLEAAGHSDIRNDRRLYA